MILFDNDLEMSALSAMVFDESCRNYGIMNIENDDISDMDNRIALTCINDEFENNSKCDSVRITERMYSKLNNNKINEIARKYQSSIITLRAFKEMIEVLKEKALIRKYRNIGLRITELTDTATQLETGAILSVNGKPTSEISKEIETMLMDSLGKHENKQCISYKDAINNALKAISDISTGKNPWIPTGIGELDTALLGYVPGELIIICGRTSVGKSIVSQYSAEQIAKTGRPVDYYSMENNNLSLANRSLSNGSMVEFRKVRTAKFDEEQAILITDAAAEKSKLPIWIDDTGMTEINNLIAKIRYNVMRHKTKVIFIDPLGCIYNSKQENLVHGIGVICLRIRALAKELNIPIILLCHLKRPKEKDDDSPPDLSDLKYSGDIENYSDIVIGLHRHDYYHQNELGYIKTHKIQAYILKGRDTGIGMIEFGYDYSKMQIKSLIEHEKFIQDQEILEDDYSDEEQIAFNYGKPLRKQGKVVL